MADTERPTPGVACLCCKEPTDDDPGDVCSLCVAWGCGAEVARG